MGKQTPSLMNYLPEMEELSNSHIYDKLLCEFDAYRPESYQVEDVLAALEKDSLSPQDFGALLSPAAEPYLEEMARRAQREMRRYFGTNITLFTPLYLANYCDNHCVYCGFNKTSSIRRAKLSLEEVERELHAIAQTGLQEILLLTGESKVMSDVEYIAQAAKLARKYFRVIGVEIYPLNTEEYAYLHKCGVDYVTVFQETYDVEAYGKLHLAGNKRVFPYRACAQERALKGGMRGVGFAALLGLSDFRKDAYLTGYHAYLIQKAYPHAEIAFSCPRLRPTATDLSFDFNEVSERELLQVMCAYRIFMPFAHITISTREGSRFRDNSLNIAASKISAGVDTGIGGHDAGEKQGDEQFEIADGRTVDEVLSAIKSHDLQPVMADYLYV